MKKSPKIIDLTWGNITVEGAEKSYKDAKLFPGGSREWNWRETGTHHRPGIQPSDIHELLENGTKVVVLTRGHQGRLQVKLEALKMLEDAGIEIHLTETTKPWIYIIA